MSIQVSMAISKRILISMTLIRNKKIENSVKEVYCLHYFTFVWQWLSFFNHELFGHGLFGCFNWKCFQLNTWKKEGLAISLKILSNISNSFKYFGNVVHQSEDEFNERQ